MISSFLEDLNSKIKSRTKEEWVKFAYQKILEVRAYVQDHGEVGFVAAFILGVFVVLFFRLAFGLFFVAALIFGLIWCMADSEIERKAAKEKQSSTIDTDHTIQ